ncbi:MAG: HlyD family efflux transporter periplasmic adaptor subunit, partial [Acetatifactor muris]|nr:HlyD family efflux transporter periplasmic adaptor subunit [Acetatifactor muris]
MTRMKKKESNHRHLSKKKKRLIMTIAAGSLLVLAAGYTVFIAPLLKEEQWVYKEEAVERGTLKVGVSESGSLEYGITSVLYDLDLDVSDEEDEDEDSGDSDEEAVQKYLKIEEVYVKSGQRINQGDILYKFTEASVSDVRALLKSAAVEAQSDYAEALSEYNLAVLEAQTDYDSRKLDEKYASAIYRNSIQSLDNEITLIQVEINQRTANIASLQEKVDEAAENYNEALEKFSGAEKPSADDYNTANFMTMQKEYLNLQTQYENAKNALSRAQQELEDNAKEIESLQQELKAVSAKKTVSRLDVEETYQENLINGENAQFNYDARLESLKETLQEAEEKKEKIQKQMDAFEAFVGEDGCLYADGAGVVTEVVYGKGDRLRNTGSMMSYAAPDDMTISVDVTQEDIVDLEVGDRVDITFTAYGDDAYKGSIQSINTTATSAKSNTVSYTVVIAVEGDTDRLYGGMTA